MDLKLLIQLWMRSQKLTGISLQFVQKLIEMVLTSVYD